MEYERVFFDATKALHSLGKRHGEGDFLGEWKDKHWMSTPGPLYCGQTDNCGTGINEAPNNVLLDEEAFQFIYRQPVNTYELRQIAQAAWDDPFNGYGADGDAHWTYEAIKAWWGEQRPAIEQEVQHLYEAMLALGTNKDYSYFGSLTRCLAYMKDGLRHYLQAYAFFLDNGRPPLENDLLPDL